jgi:hypothetical protein
MALSVQTDMINLGPSIYYEEDWHIVLESHLLLLMNVANGTPLAVNAHDAWKYEGDLWSLLQAYGQDPTYYWPIMRANGMYSPNEYKPTMTSLLIPSTQTIEQLRGLYQTVSSKLA